MNIQDIKDKTEEYGDCWLWMQATTDRGYPIFKPHGCRCTLVRRAMFALAGGALKSRQPIDTTCGEKRCVNPAHLVQSTTSKIAARAGARGAFSGKARCAKIATAKRATAKLSLDIAREIRMSPETGPVLAQRYGINRSLVTRIKAGKAWRDYTNPFAGLMSR